jgi:hypothetical protein
MNEKELERLLARLTADLRDELLPETRLKVLLFVSAAELWAELQQPADAGELRPAVAQMVLECFGAGDAAIERTRVRLTTGRDAPTLAWRN